MSDRRWARIGTVCVSPDAPRPQGASPSPRETVEDLPCSPEMSFQNIDFKGKVQASYGLRSCCAPRYEPTGNSVCANALARWLSAPDRPRGDGPAGWRACAPQTRTPRTRCSPPQALDPPSTPSIRRCVRMTTSSTPPSFTSALWRRRSGRRSRSARSNTGLTWPRNSGSVSRLR